MKKESPVRKFIQDALESLRLRTSRPDALTQLAVLSVIAGLLTGLVIVSFRLLIEGVQLLILPEGAPGNFEGLPIGVRIVLPVAGALLVALMFRIWARGEHTVGVLHVMERLTYNQGHLPLRALIMQYFGAAISIISGQSLGREGPSIHLGAATSSTLGQRLGLPNNTIRTLVACGTAAGIGASFNTPLAGVIFALEVVMMEYTLASFLPITLAAVSATAVSRAVYGSGAAFSVPSFQFSTLLELPYVMLLGVATGFVAFVFIYLTRISAKAGEKLPIWTKFLVAGSITGVLAVFAPQIMGIGYDTASSILVSNIGLTLLIMIFAAKLVATACSVGLGLPAGLIGPTFIIGACFGGIMGMLAQPVFPGLASSPGMYALIGMGAMMGATLQAPLAALTAVFELTSNPNVILPGMLAIVTAGLTTNQLLGQHSIYRTLMRLRGMDYRHNPMVQALRRVGVANIMNRNIRVSSQRVTPEQARILVEPGTEWIVIENDEPIVILPATDLANFLTENSTTGTSGIDLMEIPAKRLQAAYIDLRAAVDSAQEQFLKENMEALCIRSTTPSGKTRIYGVLTRQHFKNLYSV
ncbi:MAG: chloride channel protein [Gammaproteobacteria bacterium]|nr:chloride channel protein [Gammaproteobacteria bacterium]